MNGLYIISTRVLQVNMKPFQWDPRSNGFIIATNTCKNFLLYMNENPLYPDVPSYHRIVPWLWDYTTSTRIHLPTLNEQIYRATFHNNFIFVISIKKRKLKFYYLNLDITNSKWELIPSLTRRYDKLFLPPYLMDSKNQDLIIAYESELVLYNIVTNTSRSLPFHKYFNDDETLHAIIHVKDCLYYVRDECIVVYDIAETKVIDEHFFHNGGDMYQSQNCSGGCIHVFIQRFIFLVLNNSSIDENDEYIHFWYVAVFDCELKKFIHEQRYRYPFAVYQDNMYDDGYQNFLWHENVLCYLCCERSDNDDIRLDPHLQEATAIQYHISYFLPNWFVVRIYIMMKMLYDKNRATVLEEYQDTVQGMLYDLILEKELHHEILGYLICNDKSRYCMVAKFSH